MIIRATANIMAHLDQWHEDPELASEVYASLCHEESRILPFQGKSPQLNLRRFLVDWLAIVSENLDIESPARHLAVYLLDRTMDRFTVSGEAYLQRLALVCLLIASKHHIFFRMIEMHINSLPEL